MAPSTITESRLEGVMFFSASLDRYMPLTVLLPPYYATSEASYPVLYMLHGQGGNLDEWQWYGIAGVAERMMLSGEIQPFIIVLPEGDNSYWFNHAYGGEAWGDYVARDIVGLVDSLYWTRPWPQARAVGGLSMGADGALQLAMNYPDVFRIAGVHSPALRPYEDAYPYYGPREYFDEHYPPAQIENRPDVARSLTIWLDAGYSDPWLGNTEALRRRMLDLEIDHEWNQWEGDHYGDYWGAHIPDYLRFYSDAFDRLSGTTPREARDAAGG